MPLRIVEEYARAVKCFSTHGYGRLVNGAVQYLCTHIAEEISVSRMADELFVSEAHLSRMFRRETGKRIAQYLNEMRIEMAKNLLKQGGRNITQVATMVGYRDSCYFSRVFRARWEYRPSSTRKPTGMFINNAAPDAAAKQPHGICLCGCFPLALLIVFFCRNL